MLTMARAGALWKRRPGISCRLLAAGERRDPPIFAWRRPGRMFLRGHSERRRNCVIPEERKDKPEKAPCGGRATLVQLA
jgi:hypothetical protein